MTFNPEQRLFAALIGQAPGYVPFREYL